MVKLPPIQETIDAILGLNERITNFWKNAYGWAPSDAADLLSQARLDWQVSLSRNLRSMVRKAPAGQEDAHLILGWTNLGALVEGTMKFFLCVHFRDFRADQAFVAIVQSRKFATPHPTPDELMLEQLKQFFAKRIWSFPEDKCWYDFVDLVQRRRNAIHAYKDRPIGDRREFRSAIRTYFDFLSDVHDGVPYPDPSDFNW